MNKRVHANLKAAIKTMRDACDDAERGVDQVSDTARADLDVMAISRVIHALSWGQANATSHIENAMTAHEDEMLNTLHDLRSESGDDAPGTPVP